MIIDKDQNQTKKPDGKTAAIVTKIILGISACITAGFIFSTCGVSSGDIQECKSACGSRGMVSASQWTCQCGWTSSSNDYVIPKNKFGK